MTAETVSGLEGDIEATRKRLYETIDRIQDKLTVSGLVDEVMGSAGIPRFDDGPDFVLGLLRRHPVPVMIAAAGLGWMVYRMNRKNGARSLRGIEDADYVDVSVVNDGQARAYDPDLPSRHPTRDSLESRRVLESQA